MKLSLFLLNVKYFQRKIMVKNSAINTLLLGYVQLTLALFMTIKYTNMISLKHNYSFTLLLKFIVKNNNSPLIPDLMQLQ